MDKSKIPPINLKAAFYDSDVKEIANWFKVSNLLSDAEMEDMKFLSWPEAVEIVTRFYEAEETRKLLHDRLMNDYSRKSGIGPKKTEEILECTTTERKRWESEGKLPVVDHINVGKKSRPIWAPMYCRRTIETLNDDILERWRAEHAASISESRKSKEKVRHQSRNLQVQAYKAGEKIYPIFGPVAVDVNSIDEFWDKHKVKVPFNWEEATHVVMLIDYNTNEVIRMSVSTAEAGM